MNNRLKSFSIILLALAGFSSHAESGLTLHIDTVKKELYFTGGVSGQTGKFFNNNSATWASKDWMWNHPSGDGPSGVSLPETTGRQLDFLVSGKNSFMFMLRATKTSDTSFHVKATSQRRKYNKYELGTIENSGFSVFALDGTTLPISIGSGAMPIRIVVNEGLSSVSPFESSQKVTGNIGFERSNIPIADNKFSYPDSIVTGDVDLDGDIDIIVGNKRAPIELFLNDGNGGFSKVSALIGKDDNLPSRTQLALGDIDGDGDTDIVAGNITDRETAKVATNKLYLNDGKGGFPDKGIAIGNDNDKTFAIVLGDVDNDGDLDLVTGNDESSNKLYFNDGNGGFTRNGVSISRERNQTFDLALADVDGDGDLDLLSAHYSPGSSIQLNDGLGNFTSRKPITKKGIIANNLAAGDVDGDGDIDLVTGTGKGQTSLLYLNDGDGGFIDAPIPIGQEKNNVGDLFLADIDSDGDLDLVVQHYDSYTMLYINKESGQFSKEGIIVGQLEDIEYASGRVFTLGDLDQDGDLDLLSSTLFLEPKTFYSNRRIFYNNHVNSEEAETQIDEIVAKLERTHRALIEASVIKDKLTLVTDFAELLSALAKVNKLSQLAVRNDYFRPMLETANVKLQNVSLGIAAGLITELFIERPLKDMLSKYMSDNLARSTASTLATMVEATVSGGAVLPGYIWEQTVLIAEGVIDVKLVDQNTLDIVLNGTQPVVDAFVEGKLNEAIALQQFEFTQQLAVDYVGAISLRSSREVANKMWIISQLAILKVAEGPNSMPARSIDITPTMSAIYVMDAGETLPLAPNQRTFQLFADEIASRFRLAAWNAQKVPKASEHYSINSLRLSTPNFFQGGKFNWSTVIFEGDISEAVGGGRTGTNDKGQIIFSPVVAYSKDGLAWSLGKIEMALTGRTPKIHFTAYRADG